MTARSARLASGLPRDRPEAALPAARGGRAAPRPRRAKTRRRSRAPRARKTGRGLPEPCGSRRASSRTSASPTASSGSSASASTKRHEQLGPDALAEQRPRLGAEGVETIGRQATRRRPGSWPPKSVKPRGQLLQDAVQRDARDGSVPSRSRGLPPFRRAGRAGGIPAPAARRRCRARRGAIPASASTSSVSTGRRSDPLARLARRRGARGPDARRCARTAPGPPRRARTGSRSSKSDRASIAVSSRPAAFSRGPTRKATSSEVGAEPAGTPDSASRAWRPGARDEARAARPSAAMTRFSPSSGTRSAIVPRHAARSRDSRRRAGHPPRADGLGDLHRDRRRRELLVRVRRSPAAAG